MPTSTRTGHVQFDGTLRQICNCPTGGQRRPPLQKILRFCRRLYILWVRLAGRGRTPPLRQRGVNFTDSHWWVRLCRVVLHNPFVTASPCHLPLHKGGFGAVQTRQSSERTTLLLIRLAARATFPTWGRLWCAARLEERAKIRPQLVLRADFLYFYAYQLLTSCSSLRYFSRFSLVTSGASSERKQGNWLPRRMASMATTPI